jgi:hypothetical protein
VDAPRASSVDDARAQALAAPRYPGRPLGPEIVSAATEKCYATGATAGPDYQSVLGVLAHAIISTDYQLALSIWRDDLFIDDSYAGSINPDYVQFLLRKNPDLPPDVQAQIKQGNYRRPDIVLDDGSRKEFEEIKPDSERGRDEGRDQVRRVSQWMQRLALPYPAGSTYSASGRIPIFNTTVAGFPVDFSIRVYRDQPGPVPGLILYRYCIRADWAKLTKNGVIAVIIAIIAFLLKYGGVLPPSPVNPPILPIPIPQPNPIPIPTPASLDVTLNKMILDSMSLRLHPDLRQTLGANAEGDIADFFI